MRPSFESELVDHAEAVRLQGRIDEAFETLERFLEERPNHPRALLLRSRLFYELGRISQALEGLRSLDRIVKDKRLQSIVTALEQLGDRGKSTSAPAFVTESMARLFVRQGYLLEALEVYRRLLQGAPEKGEFWEEIDRIKAAVEQEGSRGATRERVARELEILDGWMRQQRREA